MIRVIAFAVAVAMAALCSCSDEKPVNCEEISHVIFMGEKVSCLAPVMSMLNLSVGDTITELEMEYVVKANVMFMLESVDSDKKTKLK